jgi:hypothetical protein
MGRLRIYPCNKDRQRAYRQRLKQRNAEIRKTLPVVRNRTATRRLPPIPAAYAMYEAAVYDGMTPDDALTMVLESWGNWP